MGDWHASKQHPGNDEYRLDWTVYKGDIEVGLGFSADAAQRMVVQNNQVDDLMARNARLCRAVALLNSMILSGEDHSETSRQVVREALD